MKNVNMINSKIKNIFISSWQLYIDNALYVMNIFLLVFIISQVCNVIFSINLNLFENFTFNRNNITINQDIPIYHLIFYFTSQLFITGLQLGMLKAYLSLNQNKPNDIKFLFSSFNLLIYYFIGCILLGIIICLPAYLIGNIYIIGIAVLMMGFLATLYAYMLVDGYSYKDALKYLYYLTVNHINLLLQFGLLLLILNTIGFFLMVIGLLITIPFSLLCIAKLYLLLKEDKINYS